MERLRLALGVVEKAVMTRVQPTRYWQAGTHLYGNPMTELETLFLKIVPKKDVPLREVVQEERPSRFQDAHTL